METLALLLKHAEDERDRSMATFQTATVNQSSALAQLDQLLNYRRDCETRWQGQFTQQGQMELVRSYHGFMIRLTQAVEHQQLSVKQAAERLAAARAALRERELRVASVHKLIARRQLRVRSDAARREQKLNDERAWSQVQDSAFPGDMASTY